MMQQTTPQTTSRLSRRMRLTIGGAALGLALGPLAASPVAARSVDEAKPATDRPAEVDRRPDAERKDRPSDRPSDRPTDRPVDRPSDRPVDRPSDKPTDRPVDRPSDRPGDHRIEVLHLRCEIIDRERDVRPDARLDARPEVKPDVRPDREPTRVHIGCKWRPAQHPRAVGYQLWRIVDREHREPVARGGLDLLGARDVVSSEAKIVRYAVIAVDENGRRVGQSRVQRVMVHGPHDRLHRADAQRVQ